EVERLTNEARAAAGRALWVYPPLDEPSAPTALKHVRTLERLPEDRGNERADELRHEFATALVRQGDRYLNEPGGRPFAYEFYGQAVVFEPDNARAREVGGFSKPLAAMLSAEAESGE